MPSHRPQALRRAAAIAAAVVAGIALAGCASSNQSSQVALDPQAGIDISVLGWENAGDSAAIDIALTNESSRYSQFIVDTVVTDATGTQILGYAPVIVAADAGSSEVLATADVAGPIPADARAAVANVWGRQPGDEQIHAIKLVDAQAAADDPGAPQSAVTAATAPPADWSAERTLAAAGEFARRLGLTQTACREDPSDAGLACLSRRNVPANLLPESTAAFLTVVPFFSQPDAADGPPRAFEVSDGRTTACVGQRIDKQTSAQVSIAGSCTQRGLYPGFGGVSGLLDPRDVSPQAGSATPTWSGPAPSAPPSQTAGRRTDIGTPFDIGGFVVTVDGVEVDRVFIDTPSGSIAASQGFTVVSVTVANPGTSERDTRQLRLEVFDVQGQPLSLDEATTEALAMGGAEVIAAGGNLGVPLVFDLPTGVTAAALVVTDIASGQSISIGLLPPVS